MLVLCLFLPREAICIGFCCHAVSVRPSVMLVYFIETGEWLLKVISVTHFLIFWCLSISLEWMDDMKFHTWNFVVFGNANLRMINYPRSLGRLLGHVTHAIFKQYLVVSLKRWEIGQWLWNAQCYMLIGNHRHSIEPCHYQWPWVTFEGHFGNQLSNFLAPLNSVRNREVLLGGH